MKIYLVALTLVVGIQAVPLGSEDMRALQLSSLNDVLTESCQKDLQKTELFQFKRTSNSEESTTHTLWGGTTDETSSSYLKKMSPKEMIHRSCWGRVGQSFCIQDKEKEFIDNCIQSKKDLAVEHALLRKKSEEAINN